LFFFTAPAPTEFLTLSLHDALPISGPDPSGRSRFGTALRAERARACFACSRRIGSPPRKRSLRFGLRSGFCGGSLPALNSGVRRSEEHTSELQSRGHLVCRLLLEKK